jgi:hypothetical protein
MLYNKTISVNTRIDQPLYSPHGKSLIVIWNRHRLKSSEKSLSSIHCLWKSFNTSGLSIHYTYEKASTHPGYRFSRTLENLRRHHNGQKKKVQMDKQRSTKDTYKTKDRVTRTPLKTGVELRCFKLHCQFVSSLTSSNSHTHCVTLVTKPCNNAWMKKGMDCVTNVWITNKINIPTVYYYLLSLLTLDTDNLILLFWKHFFQGIIF